MFESFLCRRGAKWTPGTSRQFSDSSSKDGFEKPKSATASIPASSPASHTSSKRSRRKKKHSKSIDRSRSRSSGSNSSRSSSSDSESGSQRFVLQSVLKKNIAQDMQLESVMIYNKWYNDKYRSLKMQNLLNSLNGWMTSVEMLRNF